MNTEVKSIGRVEGRLVYPGDKLYVDIRGTCATDWGDPQVAVQGCNEGQGPLIIFESGDYRPCDRLVWDIKALTPREVKPSTPASVPLQDYMNPDKYSKAELSSILEAFFDISDSIPEHEYIDHTGDSCQARQENYGKARKLVSDKHWGRDLLKRPG